MDSKTRESLQKSVQLAIGITTQSQEAEARHAAERTEQEARGLLERQKIQDEASAEKARREADEAPELCDTIGERRSYIACCWDHRDNRDSNPWSCILTPPGGLL